MSVSSLPNYHDVLAAADRVKQLAIRTPVLRHDAIDEAVGAEVFIKPECMQVTGSFKIRGATNRISQITDPAEIEAGVVAFSSGNHAQGVARAARHFGMPALIVMPEDAPKVKVEGVLRDNAEIFYYNRYTEIREEIAADVVAARRAVLVPSYDDRHVIAGQGTAGLEFVQDMLAAGQTVDHYISCAGGGGLLAGAALAFEALSPETKLWSAEPVDFDDHRRSFTAGEVRAIGEGGASICDAIQTPQPGDLTFAINKPRVAGGLAATDAQIMAAMKLVFQCLNLVVEPGGAAALASAMFDLPPEAKGARVGLILSGGNVDSDIYGRAVLSH